MTGSDLQKERGAGAGAQRAKRPNGQRGGSVCYDTDFYWKKGGLHRFFRSSGGEAMGTEEGGWLYICFFFFVRTCGSSFFFSTSLKHYNYTMRYPYLIGWGKPIVISSFFFFCFMLNKNKKPNLLLEQLILTIPSHLWSPLSLCECVCVYMCISILIVSLSPQNNPPSKPVLKSQPTDHSNSNGQQRRRRTMIPISKRHNNDMTCPLTTPFPGH